MQDKEFVTNPESTASGNEDAGTATDSPSEAPGAEIREKTKE
jgi:hypothetical protein